MFRNARDQRRLLLKYQPSAPEQYQKVTDDATPTKTWSREQIEDFTRKMGFLDEGSEDGSHLKFQKLSAVRHQKYLENYIHTTVALISAVYCIHGCTYNAYQKMSLFAE